MKRLNTDPLLVLIIVVALAAVALCFAVWAVPPPVGAQAAPWRVGPRDPGRVVLWAEGLLTVPAVRVVGGRGGLATCEDDGSGATWRCTLWCEGCTAIEADTVTIWGRHRVLLPVVRSR